MPVTSACTVADKHQRRKYNTADNDCDAREFQGIGKLINVGMNLLGQLTAPFRHNKRAIIVKRVPAANDVR